MEKVAELEKQLIQATKEVEMLKVKAELSRFQRA